MTSEYQYWLDYYNPNKIIDPPADVYAGRRWENSPPVVTTTNYDGRRTTTTVREYDKDGKMRKETITETVE